MISKTRVITIPDETIAEQKNLKDGERASAAEVVKQVLTRHCVIQLKLGETPSTGPPIKNPDEALKIMCFQGHKM